jgi:hypothetical protein
MSKSAYDDALTKPSCFGNKTEYRPEESLCAFRCVHRSRCKEDIDRQSSLDQIRNAARAGAAPMSPFARPAVPSPGGAPSSPSGGPVPSTQSTPVSAVASTYRPQQAPTTTTAATLTGANSAVVYERDDNNPRREGMARLLLTMVAAGFGEAARIATHDGYRYLRPPPQPRRVSKCAKCLKVTDDANAAFCVHCGRQFGTPL